MTARGEAVEIGAIAPPASAESADFSNRLAQASTQPSGRLSHYRGLISGMVVQQPGFCRRGSCERQPPIGRDQTPTDSWEDLAVALDQNRAKLDALRTLMKAPPAGLSYDLAKSMRDNSLPNFVAVRVAAQTLHTSVISDLHQGDLDAALRDLEALLSCVNLYRDDPTLVNYMIRIAVLGLSVDACWDALQADGWTEPQLAAFQRACPSTSGLLSQMPRVLETERAARLCQLESFRSQSNRRWVARYKEMFDSFGTKPLQSDAGPSAMFWRQWFFHSVWSFAWADQEKLEFAQQEQLRIQALREATRTQSWQQLKQDLTALQKDYHAPVAAWRFYTRLPLDSILVSPADEHAPAPVYPCVDFSRAWSTAMKNLTLNNLVCTAIALKRYQLKHGTLPQNLAALVPDFVPTLPADLMDGKSLRYEPYPNGSFILYSVGEDGQDDGGNAEPADEAHDRKPADSPWTGRDLLWPRMTLGLTGLH
jgi:hypothetical protein